MEAVLLTILGIFAFGLILKFGWTVLEFVLENWKALIIFIILAFIVKNFLNKRRKVICEIQRAITLDGILIEIHLI